MLKILGGHFPSHPLSIFGIFQERPLETGPFLFVGLIVCERCTTTEVFAIVMSCQEVVHLAGSKQ